LEFGAWSLGFINFYYLLSKFMSLRWYLIIMTVATICCWLAFGYILQTINPEITNWLGFLLFYASLFLALIGTVSLIGFIIRFIGLKHELITQSVVTAFRQSFLFASFIIIILLLLANNLFSWLNLIFLIIGLSVLEFFLLSYKRNEIIASDDDKTNIDEVK